MGLKGLFKMLFKGSSELKALRGEVASLRGELNAARAGKLSKAEAAALESLNGGRAAQMAAEGDVVVVAAKAVKGRASSKMLGEGNYLINDLKNGMTLKANSVYRSTVDDVIRIGKTELSLSDPRIVRALESKGMGGQIVIGRSSSCDVVIKDATVSGEHLIIKAKSPGSKRLYIEDLNSTNGTKIVKSSKYSPADRAKDAQRGKEYIEGLSGKHNPKKSNEVEVIEAVPVKEVNVKSNANKAAQKTDEDVIAEPYEDMIAEPYEEVLKRQRRELQEIDDMNNMIYMNLGIDDYLRSGSAGIADDIIDIL